MVTLGDWFRLGEFFCCIGAWLAFVLGLDGTAPVQNFCSNVGMHFVTSFFVCWIARNVWQFSRCADNGN